MDCVPEDSTRPMSTSHHNFYFPDGNIILSAIHRPIFKSKKAPPEAECLLFRVHKSILAKYSEFFSTLFDLPNSPENSPDPLYDGVPVIVMLDSAAEIESLLSYFYAPW